MPIERNDPPLVADEGTTLLAFLDYHRATLRLKTEGLSPDQLAATLAPSTLSLAGLLKHLALVESSWFQERLAGGSLMAPFDTAPWEEDQDWEFHTAAGDDPEQLRDLFETSVAASDDAIRAALADGGLDTLSVVPSRREGEGHYSLRWILLHMIEEYARHNGHADLIRESIDGVIGE